MAKEGQNIVFPIYSADGSSFNGLVLHKATYDSVVMSLGDKITGDVYYKDNTLTVTMQEYVVYKGVKYNLVNPPTIVREGMVSDNSSLKGMTKYSFEFYHPMYWLSNFPFTDIAVSTDQAKYLSQNKTFSWMGTGLDLIAKINKNLADTEWICIASDNSESLAKMKTLPDEVLPFDNNFISDVLKTFYDTWEVPFIIDSIESGEYKDSDGNDYYAQGKRFCILFGLPSNEITTTDADGNKSNFVFKFGQGVGLKNSSRTPKNNKIVTRIAGYGSEDNIPYGYPQIPWTGDSSWNYTINNDSTAENSYPIYKGILGGKWVKLIKHPFTRDRLMPSIYRETVNKKVNPNADGYDPDTVIKDYYDADGTYPNPINTKAPSYESHQFEKIKPELGEQYIVSVEPYSNEAMTSISLSKFETMINSYVSASDSAKEKEQLKRVLSLIKAGKEKSYSHDNLTGSYNYTWSFHSDDDFYYVTYQSSNVNFTATILKDGHTAPAVDWDDSMDDDGNYNQSYFKITLPQLDFDLYACAAITQEMNIIMRGGDCIGCTFPVQVDWDDYKSQFYDSDGNFAPDGENRNLEKYPDSSKGQITLIVQKDTNTYGTIMPDRYRIPEKGDQFVITGISLPESYITNAEQRLDEAQMEYMRENNVYYYEYPLKFDEFFLANNTAILSQIRNNTIVRFMYAGVENVLYVKQITIKYGDKVLPQYDITLTDDVEIVLNQIGQVTDDVSRMRVQVNELQKYYGESVIKLINDKLSRVADDVALGRITFQQGLVSIGDAIFYQNLQSYGFTSGMDTGKGWKIDALGNLEVESIRVRSYIEASMYLINRIQAQEGDTVFSENDEIEYVQKDTVDDVVYYTLSLKEKWSGYFTAEAYGNIIQGRVNTLAAKAAGVSDYSETDTDYQQKDRGGNLFYTSWMRVVETVNDKNDTLDSAIGELTNNQIRVVLYGDTDVPAQKNFEPCELMVIVRKGCVNYGDESDTELQESIRQRQQVFYLSTTEGRIVKLIGVNKPILEEGNYGITLGTIPDFIKGWDSWSRLVEEHPHLVDRDYLYAQGIIYEDLVHVDIKGAPVPVTVECTSDWIDGATASGTATDDFGDTVDLPAVRQGIYFNCGWNEKANQFERHIVRHTNGRWLCLQNQPVVSGETKTYYEPKWNSPYWKLIDGDGHLTIEFSSSKGWSFRKGFMNTVVTPFLFYGNVDITDDVPAENWYWTRELETPTDESKVRDTTWNAQHKGVKSITLTDDDMDILWSNANKQVFTCHVTVNDGKSEQIVDNQIIK